MTEQQGPDEDVEGHSRARFDPEGSEEDVEGHKVLPDDDVEGHKVLPDEGDDGDDVGGHAWTRT
jgi:hypothetical protein